MYIPSCLVWSRTASGRAQGQVTLLKRTPVVKLLLELCACAINSISLVVCGTSEINDSVSLHFENSMKLIVFLMAFLYKKPSSSDYETSEYSEEYKIYLSSLLQERVKTFLQTDSKLELTNIYGSTLGEKLIATYLFKNTCDQLIFNFIL